ncbi:homing endonuclease associated repeat-containing protein [Haladaptatus sp. NG-SE-30]
MDDQTPQSLTTEETDATERKDGVDLLPGHSTRIPTSRLLSELQHLADEKGRAPTVREMNEEGTYSAKTFCNRFGSWTNSLGELELEPSSAGSEIQICKQDIKESIRELADRLGHVPTVVEMKSHGSYSPKTAQARYGS